MNEETIKWLCARVCALQGLLVEKGVLDMEEIERVHFICVGQLDQLEAKKREEFLAENPAFMILERISKP